MNDAYIRTVQLLLDIAPSVFDTPRFAMMKAESIGRIKIELVFCTANSPRTSRATRRAVRAYSPVHSS